MTAREVTVLTPSSNQLTATNWALEKRLRELESGLEVTQA